MGEIIGSLKEQGKAILVMLFIAVLSVLGMVVLGYFQDTVVGGGLVGAPINTSIVTLIAAFIAGFALVGGFATLTMLIIVVKAIIGVVKGLS